MQGELRPEEGRSGHMSPETYELSPHKIERHLKKPRHEFTKADLMRFIEEFGIQMLNFRYPGSDGKLKTLNFSITDRAHLDRLLSAGERVDGSNLFTSIDPSSSDLYVVPRFRTAFVNPFCEILTVDVLCSFYSHDGTKLAGAPEHIAASAQEALKITTGFTMEAMGELEYYVFFDLHNLYPGTVRRGYHESSPFSKGESLRIQAMQAIAQAGGKIKYGHSEVGYVFTKNNCMEQHEIEFLPVSLEDAADQIMIAKWVLRMIGHSHGLTVTFAPKIAYGHAGSGLHIHTRLMRNGKNAMVTDRAINETARKMIAGYLSMASSITAFGNTVPVSYLRLVPHQEAPTCICWGERNRSALVRVPLGWLHDRSMMHDANPHEKEKYSHDERGQTIEYRGGDGSADIYLMLAGLAVAARYGFEREDSLELAKKLHVNVNIFDQKASSIQTELPHLPTSCSESADYLEKDRAIYESNSVFPPVVIDDTLRKLRSYNDKGLSDELYGKEEDIRKLVEKYIHCA